MIKTIQLTAEIKEILYENTREKVISVEALSGGDINYVYKCKLENQTVVIKINDKDLYPEMFEKEKLGLRLLSNSSFVIPKVLSVGQKNQKAYIIMEYISKAKSFNWELFGRNLAFLHKKNNNTFGLNHDNYIGSLLQINKSKDSWVDFYMENRILYLIEKATNKGLINYESSKKVESLSKKIESIVPKKKPSLLHGDLWSGNLISDLEGNPTLIDPAVYFGHSDIDWAMLHLFGNPPNHAIDSYNEIIPIDYNWKDSLEIHQLYPLLVHLILFGRGYYESVMKIIKKYS